MIKRIKEKLKEKLKELDYWWAEEKESDFFRILFMPITIPIGLVFLFLSLFYREKDKKSDNK